MDADTIARLKAALDELSPTLETRNDTPSTAMSGVGEEAGEARKRLLTAGDQIEMRERLHKLSTPALLAMFGQQARKRDSGIPVDLWMAAGGNSQAVSQAFAQDPTLTKALDSSGAAALIRQDLEPIIYELYIRQFPAWDRFQKEPSNGLVHAFDRQTSFGGAKFMSELGTVTDDVAAYERATAPITTLATRRGVTLRAQYGTLQSGSGFNPEQRELQAGLRAIASTMQKTIFQGNATASGSLDATTEDGQYDALAFTGLRKTLNGVVGSNVPEDVDPTAGTPEDMRAAINDALISVMQKAGRTSVLYMSPEVKGQFDKQQDKNVRYNDNLVNVGVGVLTNTVNTVFGPLGLFPVPGDSIGEYTKSGHTVSDIYALDEDAISIPFLGSDGPQVVEVPFGASGQLTRLFIIFGMWGLAVKSIQFHNKIRVRQ
jgi:hypothetical protein